ncbi:methylamine utilization protein MauG [Parasedimentitalea maritima]|uniref:Methylamine utilization protein MauG n=1 Tax=Parasedimentitalea maritima TaxID=2578117 RepID=A0ABY2USN6_9RHOB|nr:cytochrome c peroxidase [Zongyanglinia marina]TLP61395.1 methylamine utilization protein MauG [Zongyanglinia marina]
MSVFSRLKTPTLALIMVTVWSPGLLAEQSDPSVCPTSDGSWSERALERSLSTQLGLPTVPHPVDNPPTAEKITLGRKLFFDRRMSINGTMSCAMCHVPEQGFANWELQTSVGVEGRSVKRNAPTIINTGFLDVLFHDGRDMSLETQFIMPLISRNEMANPSVGRVVAYLQEQPEYQPLFDAAFGAPPSLDRMGKALGAYQRTLTTGGSAFDHWYYGGDKTALSDSQTRGFELFQGKADCASCHVINDQSALFTDQEFHNTGYGWQREQIRQNPSPTTRVQVAPNVFHEIDLAVVASVSAPPQADLGRYEVTEDPDDRWMFRTPPLRNVAMTPPYMHDGALPDLRSVIEFYNQGGPDHVFKDLRIRPLDLNSQEMDDLEAFMQALTSPGLDCLAAEARINAPDNF